MDERGRNYVLYLTAASVDIEEAYQRGDASVNLATCSKASKQTYASVRLARTHPNN